MRVVLCPTPYLLTWPSADAIYKLKISGSQPSIVTVIGSSRGVNKFFHLEPPKHINTARLTQTTKLKTRFATWINYLSLSSEHQHDYRKENSLNITKTEVAGQSPATLLRRISHMLSDIIIFTGETLNEVAEHYLCWLRSCENIKEDHYNFRDKPIACVLVEKRNHNVEAEFMTLCLSNNKAQLWNEGDLKRNQRKLFNMFEFVEFSNINMELNNQLSNARRRREVRRHMWSDSTFFRLHAYIVESLAGRIKSSLSFVEFLNISSPVELASQELWSELIRMRQDAGALESFILPLMGNCFARNALKCDHSECRHLYVVRLLIILVFHVDEIFSCRYQVICEKLFSIDEVLKIKEVMKESMIKYDQSPNKSHYKELKCYKHYWKTVILPHMCFACLESVSRIFFPCKHGICDNCYRNLTSSEQVSNTLLTCCGFSSCDTCPFCQTYLNDFEVILPPPTASARILSLDGGGAKGIVSIKVLKSLERELGYDIPFYRYFDLFIGTSAGKIIKGET